MNESDTVDEKDNNSTPTQNNGPGDQLQAARIKQGLSIEDVATRMHLSIAILQSIEDNDFTNLTAPIFVKGYLRAYARLVSLDEDDMIQRYVEFYSNEDPPINTTSQMAPEISSQDARVKWTTYLVIIVLIALLSAWWWNKSQNESEAVFLDTDQFSDQATTGQVVQPEIIEISSDADEGVDETASEPALDDISNASTVDGDTLTTVSDDDTVSGIVAEVEVIETTEPLPVVVAAAPEPEPAIEVISTEDSTAQADEPATDSAFDISRAAPTGNDLLNIRVNADTWADIKDANNHRLVYDLLRANLNVQIKGKAPFNAFFGNGHGVEISFNSETIDIASRILDDNTARLKIGTN